MSDDLAPVIGILERLVGFDTISDRTNRHLIEYVADYLSAHDVSFITFPDRDGLKRGLIAKIGPDEEGGIVLSGHTDVVPVKGQAWTAEPWVLTRRDDRYFGRGACDMKGFLALALAAVPGIIASPLQRPVILAFSFDEEIGCRGTEPLIEALDGFCPRAGAVVVGEPTEMGVVTGHKGAVGLRTTVTGKAAHSSCPDRGVSAIAHAASLIDWHTRQMARAKAAASDDEYAAPYTTLQVGTVRGGIAINTVPADCVFETDIRFLPSETAERWIEAYRREVEEVERAMRSEHSEAGIAIEVTENVPAMRVEANGAAESLARRLTGDRSIRLESYQTEAGHFQAAGYSTVICGPGSIDQAHKPDEFISTAELQKGRQFIDALIETLA